MFSQLNTSKLLYFTLSYVNGRMPVKKLEEHTKWNIVILEGRIEDLSYSQNIERHAIIFQFYSCARHDPSEQTNNNR